MMEQLISDIIRTFKDALLGGAGGLVVYLYHFAKNKEGDTEVRMDWAMFIINGIVGAFMAFALGDLIPDNIAYRDGLLGLVGVVGFGLIGAVESKFVKVIMKKVDL
jgi:hypothetical protein